MKNKHFTSGILITIGILFWLLIPFGYWLLHGDYDRYLWVINGPFPFSDLGGGPLQMGLMVLLALFGLIFIITAILILVIKNPVSLIFGKSGVKRRIQEIVKKSRELKNTHTTAQTAPVNYSCIFAHSEEEYQELDAEVAKMGKVVKQTEMGNVYLLVKPIEIVAGPLRIVKIRKPDPKRPERGDADFTVADYPAFKKEYLNKPGFKLIKRPDMEMIELADEKFDVLAYFSHPTLGEVLGLKI